MQTLSANIYGTKSRERQHTKYTDSLNNFITISQQWAHQGNWRQTGLEGYDRRCLQQTWHMITMIVKFRLKWSITKVEHRSPCLVWKKKNNSWADTHFMRLWKCDLRRNLNKNVAYVAVVSQFSITVSKCLVGILDDALLCFPWSIRASHK